MSIVDKNYFMVPLYFHLDSTIFIIFVAFYNLFFPNRLQLGFIFEQRFRKCFIKFQFFNSNL